VYQTLKKAKKTQNLKEIEQLEYSKYKSWCKSLKKEGKRLREKHKCNQVLCSVIRDKIKDLKLFKEIKIDKSLKKTRVNTRKYFIRKNKAGLPQDCKDLIEVEYAIYIYKKPKFHNYNILGGQFLKDGKGDWVKEINNKMEIKLEMLKRVQQENKREDQLSISWRNKNIMNFQNRKKDRSRKRAKK